MVRDAPPDPTGMFVGVCERCGETRTNWTVFYCATRTGICTTCFHGKA